ncbi:MAG: response regulator [Planctomycetes bacterium]|nr:response regulator [Planctomycetota bacterium]MCB9879987.1 response regulator [Planctomycetota bacterium]
MCGFGFVALAGAMFVDAWRAPHEGMVAQVAAVEEIAARSAQFEQRTLEAKIAAAAVAVRDAVVRQVLTAPDDQVALAALLGQLGGIWPIVDVAIEQTSPPGGAERSTFRWPVVASMPELGQVVVTVDDGVAERLRDEQAGRVVDTVAAIERVGSQVGQRQRVGLGVCTLLLVALAAWMGARFRRRPPPDSAIPPASMERVEAAQAAFLAMMSHELRTPLNAVLGASELLRATALDPEQRELLSVSDRSGRQLLSLVDGLLDLAELEGGRLHVARSVFDIELLLEDALQMFAEAAQAKGLGLELELDEGFPDIVVGDEARLREVLVALLSNAVKFTARGAVRLVARSVGPAGRTLRVEVVDTGVGIDAASIPRLFGRFEQGQRGSTRGADGAGVGLALARALVQRMGGRIGAVSEPGQGSTFWFELPNGRPGDLERQEFAMMQPLRGRRVLLLTSSEELAARVTGQLLSQGCEVSLFSPSRAADLASAPDLAWDCVVVDVEVATRFGAGWGRCMPPTVVLGNHREVRGGELVRLPVRKSELLQAVQRACRRPAAASGTRRRRVLVAEDNPVNRRMVEKMLEVVGCDAVVTADGFEALAAWREAAFDLVLMDYQMPNLDGPQTAQRLRALPGGAAVPIVAFTANSSDDVRDACRAAGMDGFLAKPLRLADLEQVVARWAPRAAEFVERLGGSSAQVQQ